MEGVQWYASSCSNSKKNPAYNYAIPQIILRSGIFDMLIDPSKLNFSFTMPPLLIGGKEQWNVVHL
jgi:hypothetical protein